jgi:surface antigen
MKRKYKISVITITVLLIAFIVYKKALTINPNPKYEVGQKLDSLNGVYVYYNGGVGHTGERNSGEEGYNIGLKYQCVEFAKRYYYQYYKHKMPDAYGNAKDFFNEKVADGKLNEQRNLLQFTHPSIYKPCIGDLIVFDGHPANKYGHVAIISAVTNNEIEIIQQNPGPFAHSRVKLGLKLERNKYFIERERVLGWLRIK